MKIIYEYMILYLLPSGSGKAYITRNSKIKSIKDVEELDEWLKSDDFVSDIPKPLKEKIYTNEFKLLRRYIGK